LPAATGIVAPDLRAFAGGAIDLEAPAERFYRLGEARESRAVAHRRTAHSVIGDLDFNDAVAASRPHAHLRR
jgi:hypothetical protein